MDDQSKRLKEIEKAGAIQGAGMAQNEIAAMAQEQKGNLLQEKQALMQQAQERATVSQAAEMGVASVAEMAQAQQPGAAPAPAMNAQTQEILSKYGINPSQKTQPKNTTVSKSTTKQGSTVVETITNTTNTNHNVIRIIQPNIPVSRPQISMREGAISNAKFKSWLQKANARQEELATEQMNDYNRRERDLIRTTNRMMRKLQDLSSTISSKVDPENMVNSVSGSFKTFMFLYMTTLLPIVWKPLMKNLNALEADFRRFFGLPLPSGITDLAIGGGKSKVTTWKEALGMRGDLDSQSVLGGVKKLIVSAFDRLMKELEVQRKDRENAIRRVQKKQPESSIWKIEDWVKYLGELGVAALGGTEAQLTYSEGSRIEAEKTEEIKNEKGVVVNGREVSMKGEFDERGNLRNEDSALKMTHVLSNELGKDAVDVGKVQTIVKKLSSYHKRSDKLIPIPPDFADKLGTLVSKEDLVRLIDKYQKKGEYSVDTSSYAYKNAMSDYDPGKEYSILGSMKTGALTGATAGLMLGRWLGPKGMVVGTALGVAGGALHGLGSAVWHEITGREDMQMSLVPREKLNDKEKDWMKQGKYVYPAAEEMVSPEFIQELIGMTDKGNAFSSENYKGIETKLTQNKKEVKVDKTYKDVFDDTQKTVVRREELANEDTQFNEVVNNVKGALGYETDTIMANVKLSEKEQIDAGKKIIDYLKSNLGLTEEQAAGVAGNLFVESGFSPTALGDQGKALGLAQWRDSRRVAMVKDSGTENPTFDQQLKFLVKELNTTERNALKQLQEQTTVKDSAYVFAKFYERPAKGIDGNPLHFNQRWGYAENLFNIRNNTTEPSASTPEHFVLTNSYDMNLSSAVSVNPDYFMDMPTSVLAEAMTERKTEEGGTVIYLDKLINSTNQLVEFTGMNAELSTIPRVTQQNVTVSKPEDKQSDGGDFTTKT